LRDEIRRRMRRVRKWEEEDKKEIKETYEKVRERLKGWWQVIKRSEIAYNKI
jgi:hypothetical protein